VIRPAVAKEEEEVGEVIFVEGALPIRFPDWGGGGGGGAPAPFRGDSPGRGGGGGGSGSRPTKWPNFSPAEGKGCTALFEWVDKDGRHLSRQVTRGFYGRGSDSNWRCCTQDNSLCIGCLDPGTCVDR